MAPDSKVSLTVAAVSGTACSFTRPEGVSQVEVGAYIDFQNETPIPGSQDVKLQPKEMLWVIEGDKKVSIPVIVGFPDAPNDPPKIKILRELSLAEDNIVNRLRPFMPRFSGYFMGYCLGTLHILKAGPGVPS